EDFLPRAKVDRIAHAPCVSEDPPRVTMEDRGVLDARQTGLTSEERLEDFRDAVARGDEERENRAGRGSDQMSDLARLRIGARPEAAGERESARFERAADAEVPEDRFDFAAGGAKRDALEVSGPESGRHVPLYDARACGS